jgi:hypothetical protein
VHGPPDGASEVAVPVSKQQGIDHVEKMRPLAICSVGFRSAQWGDVEVGYTQTVAGDHTPLCVGLPGDVCLCPHDGYMLKGRLRCRYPGTDWSDDVAQRGDAYFFRSGHLLICEEPSEVVEVNPAFELQYMMDHIEKKAEDLVEN